jgi:hypothetical protein
VRLRGKPCPASPRSPGADGDEGMRATEAPLGPGGDVEGRRCRCVNLAAGECGVKDQVSRTQLTYAGCENDASGIQQTVRIGIS